jgi:hypothetical protein
MKYKPSTRLVTNTSLYNPSQHDPEPHMPSPPRNNPSQYVENVHPPIQTQNPTYKRAPKDETQQVDRRGQVLGKRINGRVCNWVRSVIALTLDRTHH